MVYNSKLSGALLVLAFLACLFVVSSAENIHEQPLSDTALEGGLKESPNDALKKGLTINSMVTVGMECKFSFHAEDSYLDCKCPLSKHVTCTVRVPNPASCPKLLNSKVKVHFRETSNGKFELEMYDLNIEGLKKTFKSEVIREPRGRVRRSYTTYVKDDFEGFTVYVCPGARERYL
eukprot:Nk52_evm1s964 gene=Nk52_evmTU1s964